MVFYKKQTLKRFIKVQQQQGVINLVLAYATLAKEVVFLKDIVFQKIKNRQHTN